MHEALSFDNTENAFKGKDNGALERSYWLFRLIGSPLLVKLGATLGPLAIRLGMKGLVRRTIFRQFVGGEAIADCRDAIDSLARNKVGTILDYSVEGKESEEDFDNCVSETLRTIERAKSDPSIPFCVFKVTGLARFALLEKVSSRGTLTPAERAEWEKVKLRVSQICTQAARASQRIFIDAEESWIQPAIDELADANMEACNRASAIVYNTYQLYRTDRLRFLEQSISRARERKYFLGAKLVRGAYMEKERKRALQMGYPSPIQPDKPAADRDYDRAVEVCMDNLDIVSLCAGTHNEASSMKVVQLMKKHGLANNDPRVYFSQLYGMSDHISFNLSLAGYNVAKYVPYGPVAEVLPYLIRRAQENTSVKGQTGRELALITREKRRRR